MEYDSNSTVQSCSAGCNRQQAHGAGSKAVHPAKHHMSYKPLLAQACPLRQSAQPCQGIHFPLIHLSTCRHVIDAGTGVQACD